MMHRQTRIHAGHSVSEGCCNMEYSSDVYLKLKYRETSFVHNTHFSCQIASKICTNLGSATAVLCAQF